MKVFYCDRCKKKVRYGLKELREGSLLLIPVFNIEYQELSWNDSKEIDLCDECSKELYEWIFHHSDKGGD